MSGDTKSYRSPIMTQKDQQTKEQFEERGRRCAGVLKEEEVATRKNALSLRGLALPA